MFKPFTVFLLTLSLNVYAENISVLADTDFIEPTPHTVNLYHYNQNYLQYTQENHWLTTSNKESFHLNNIHNGYGQRGLIWDAKTQIISEDASIYVSYRYGDFVAESGFSEAIISNIPQQKYFLQGSYNLYSYEKFTLTLNAKFESKHVLEKSGSVKEQQLSLNSNVNNAAIGLVGQYSINDHWTLSGTITTTANTANKSELLPIESKYSNIALIGTSYSF